METCEHWFDRCIDNEYVYVCTGIKLFRILFCNFQGSKFVYKPGDTIGIIPHNTAEDVDAVISHLGLEKQANLSYTLTTNTNVKGKIPPHIPVKSTLKHLFTYSVDLRSILKKVWIMNMCL